MNRKQKIIVSITGITVVMLALLGLTYGYYLTNIYGNTNSNSISITTSDLKLTYKDGTGELIASGVMPGDEITSKKFTVENDGTNDIEAYTVALINIMNNFTFKDDLEVSISCSSNINNGKCDGFAEEYVNNIYKEKYPAVNSELFSLGIKKDEIHTYTLTVDYLYQEFDQSDDMGKTLKGKVQIFDPKDTIEVSGEVTGSINGDYVEIHSEVQTSEIVDGKYKFVGIPADNHEIYIKNREIGTEKSTTLEIKKGQSESTTNNIITFIDTSKVANVTIDTTNTNLSTTINKVSDGSKTLTETIEDDTRITKNTGTLDFTTSADYKITGDPTSGEIGMYSAEDDYGTSWFFRGVQSYNYVNFAGFTWRIVRVNGDGSIRIILSDALDKIIREGETKVAGSTSKYSSLEDNAGVGYMYGYTNVSDYDKTHQNLHNSNIKNEVDKFYTNYIENNEKNYHYQQYLSDNLFCCDKELAEGSGYGLEDTKYAAYDRLFVKKTPSLKCAEGSSNTYSRYTSKIDLSTTTITSVAVNNDLDYPIALLSGDELIMAGSGGYNVAANTWNKNYYLSLPHEQYYDQASWTMTPIDFLGGNDYGGVLSFFVMSGNIQNMVTRQRNVRPVVNLRNDLLVDKGNGTSVNPYTIKLPN